MSVPDWAARNHYLRTAGWHTMNYERYHATASRRKLSLLSHGPNLCPFHLYYSHYITIISLLYVLFQKSETGSGCIFIAKNLPICTSTSGDQWAYKPRASETQSSSTKVSSPRCQMQQPAHQDRSRGGTQANPHAIQFWTYHPIDQESLQWLLVFPARRDWQFQDRYKPAQIIVIISIMHITNISDISDIICGLINQSN